MNADADTIAANDRFISVRRGTLFAISAAVLVFFNYLFFLKWFPVLESRIWVAALLLLGLPGALASIKSYRSAALPALFLVTFECIVCVNYLLLQKSYFDPLYLVGHLILTLPFFALGVLAACRPTSVRNVILVASLAFLAILGWCFVNGIPLRDDVGFADILHIRSTFGDETYRTHYQLIGYGIAFGALMIISSFVAANHLIAAHIALALLAGISLWVGARGPLVALIVAYAIILAMRQGVLKTAGQLSLLALAATALLLVVDISDTAFFQKITLDINAGSNAGFTTPEIERQSRINLYTAAVNGWLTSPFTLIFGNGFGSFSVGYGSNYPSWIFAPADDYIYPHNFVLEALYELGITGLIPLLMALLWPLGRLTRSASPTLTGVELSILSLLIFSIVLALFSGTFATNHVLYFALGLASSGFHSNPERN